MNFKLAQNYYCGLVCSINFGTKYGYISILATETQNNNTAFINVCEQVKYVTLSSAIVAMICDFYCSQLFSEMAIITTFPLCRKRGEFLNIANNSFAFVSRYRYRVKYCPCSSDILV